MNWIVLWKLVRLQSSFIETSQVFVTEPMPCPQWQPGRCWCRQTRHWSDFPSARSVCVNHAPISLREFPLTLIPPLQCSALFGDIRKMAAAPLYCVCRQPYDFNRFMIECDICNDWFHGRYGNYGLLIRCGSVGMYRPPCHGGILAVNQGCHVKVLVTRDGVFKYDGARSRWTWMWFERYWSISVKCFCDKCVQGTFKTTCLPQSFPQDWIFLLSFRSELPKATWLICMCVMKLDI